MPYPIFKDATGRELHLIGRDKVELNNAHSSNDGIEGFKNSQSQRKSLSLASRRWNIDWENNG